MTCISCNKTHNENYCPYCGERSGIKKITLKSIIEDAFSSVTNMDKGFLFNCKALILRPQKITTNYIYGKRKGILNPISFLIISTTIYLIVLTVFKVPKVLNEINNTPKSTLETLANEVGLFIRTYFKYFWILSIIPLSVSLKLVFKKYNFFEHLAISSFVIGQATLIGVISFLVLKLPLFFDPIVYFTIAWMIYRIFKEKDKLETSLLSFVVLILFIIQLFFIIVAIGWIKA